MKKIVFRAANILYAQPRIAGEESSSGGNDGKPILARAIMPLSTLRSAAARQAFTRISPSDAALLGKTNRLPVTGSGKIL
jgi:hypothetical protein